MDKKDKYKVIKNDVSDREITYRRLTNRRLTKREPKKEIQKSDEYTELLKDVHESFIKRIFKIIKYFAKLIKDRDLLNFDETNYVEGIINKFIKDEKNPRWHYTACIIFDLVLAFLIVLGVTYLFIPLLVLGFVLTNIKTFLEKTFRYTINIFALLTAIGIVIYFLNILNKNAVGDVFESINNWGIVEFYKKSYSILKLDEIFSKFIEALKMGIGELF